MNKAQLVAAVARDLRTSKASAERTVNCVLAAIRANVRRGVNIVGFGTFTTVRRKAHRVRNPRTGALIVTKATTSVKFRPGKLLRRAARDSDRP